METLLVSIRRMVTASIERAFLSEKEGAADYRAAAEKTSIKDLADTYLALSEDETRHSRTIGCIIENMM